MLDIDFSDKEFVKKWTFAPAMAFIGYIVGKIGFGPLEAVLVISILAGLYWAFFRFFWPGDKPKSDDKSKKDEKSKDKSEKKDESKSDKKDKDEDAEEKDDEESKSDD